MKKKIIYLLVAVIALTLTGCGVKIKPSAASQVKYEKYDNGLVSFYIPKGWVVDIPTVDYIHYNFKVYDPEDPNYIFFFALKFEGYTKSQKARDWYKKYYSSQVFAKLPAIDPQNTEAFFKVWNEAADYSNKEEVKRTYFNHINNFEVIALDSSGTTALTSGAVIKSSNEMTVDS